MFPLLRKCSNRDVSGFWTPSSEKEDGVFYCPRFSDKFSLRCASHIGRRLPERSPCLAQEAGKSGIGYEGGIPVVEMSGCFSGLPFSGICFSMTLNACLSCWDIRRKEETYLSGRDGETAFLPDFSEPVLRRFLMVAFYRISYRKGALPGAVP